MPNTLSHTIYKNYVDMIKDKDAAEAHAKAEAAEEIMDEMT